MEHRPVTVFTGPYSWLPAAGCARARNDNHLRSSTLEDQRGQDTLGTPAFEQGVRQFGRASL